MHQCRIGVWLSLSGDRIQRRLPIVIGDGLKQNSAYLRVLTAVGVMGGSADGDTDYGRLVDKIGDDGFVLFSTNQKYP